MGYIVPSETVNREDIITYLKISLPEYMIPMLVELEQLPLTSNGKIDKHSLPEPESSLLSTHVYVAPRNAVEEMLAAIWRELLEMEQVGVNDNFFELGGHSLIVIRMLSRIRKLGYKIHLSDLMIHKTIAEQAAVLSGDRNPGTAERGKLNNEHIRLLNEAEGGEPVFIIPGGVGIVDGYDRMAKVMEKSGPVYGLSMMGTFNGEIPLDSLEEIAAQNIKWIKQIQAEGPYRIVGHSFGGWVAYEMVKQFEAIDEQVSFAAIMDVSPRPDVLPSGDARLMKDTVEYLEVFEIIVPGALIQTGWRHSDRNWSHYQKQINVHLCLISL